MTDVVTVQVISPPDETVIVRVVDDEVVSVIVPAEEAVTVTGVAGVGPAGPPGPPGPTDSALLYVHTQDAPSVLWTMHHNLNAYPNVTIVDTLGRQIEADIVYVDANTTTAGFEPPTTGKAFHS